MNIKKVFLLGNLFFYAGVTLAGDVIVKSPPQGVRLITTSGVLVHGDPDMKMSTTAEKPLITINISPEVEIAGQKHIIGMVSVFHRANGTGQMLSNQNNCDMNTESSGYSVTVDNVGFKSVTCNVNQRFTNFQKASEGVANVVVTYNKLP